MKQVFIQSSQIYRQPSFFKGIARMFDLFGMMDRHNTQSSDQTSDLKATKRDWKIIGNDIKLAINQYGTHKK